MKEIVIISGKGGTGKTSITASFASLSSKAVIADCDVDAADLYLVLNPEIQYREPFKSGVKLKINPAKCTACGKCKEVCAFDAIEVKKASGDGKASNHQVYRIDQLSCEGCTVCAYFCPAKAIEQKEAVCGEWFVSKTRCGPLVHAKLKVAEENSGKLVTLVRNQAKEIAEKEKADLVILDGPPGIGCPVIASIGGTDLALIVCEPTLSGLHDFERALKLTKHFRVETLVCINKYDLNKELSAEIEKRSTELGTHVAGKISYDPAVTEAQLNRTSTVEYTDGKVAKEIKKLWTNLLNTLK